MDFTKFNMSNDTLSGVVGYDTIREAIKAFKKYQHPTEAFVMFHSMKLVGHMLDMELPAPLTLTWTGEGYPEKVTDENIHQVIYLGMVEPLKKYDGEGYISALTKDVLEGLLNRYPYEDLSKALWSDFLEVTENV